MNDDCGKPDNDLAEVQSLMLLAKMRRHTRVTIGYTNAVKTARADQRFQVHLAAIVEASPLQSPMSPRWNRNKGN
jgi:hypothetical protein